MNKTLFKKKKKKKLVTTNLFTFSAKSADATL